MRTLAQIELLKLRLRPRYYDPLAGQFTSADSVLPGDDPWSLSRYAYVAGNPLIRLDPTGHCWVVCAIVHAVTHAVKAAVKVVAVVADFDVGDAVLPAPNMRSFRKQLAGHYVVVSSVEVGSGATICRY